MQRLNRDAFPGAQYPDRVIQFGEGNFLRAFIDWQLDLLNEHTRLDAGVVIHLLKAGRDPGEIEDLLYHRSGLLGASGISAATERNIDRFR